MILTTAEQHIDYQRIARAIQYLQENLHRQPALEEVAEEVHLSPFHFQRIFTDWAGISPKKFLQYLTAGYLKEKLGTTQNIAEAADATGLSSPSRVYDLFTTLEAMTPAEYKRHGAGIGIDYGFHETPFGYCLLGVTTRGICWLSFIDFPADANAALHEMKAFWFNSAFQENHTRTKDITNQIFSAGAGKKLHLFVKGTNFQVKVWEALLRIPPGAVTTYQHIARRINNPKALQAVGSAVGSNSIAYLIPCHRVIRKDCILGEYRWSAPRKKCMIGWEMARNDTPNNHSF